MSGRLNFVKRWENTVAGHDSTAMSYMTVKTMNSIELKHLIAVVHEIKVKVVHGKSMICRDAIRQQNCAVKNTIKTCNMLLNLIIIINDFNFRQKLSLRGCKSGF